MVNFDNRRQLSRQSGPRLPPIAFADFDMPTTQHTPQDFTAYVAQRVAEAGEIEDEEGDTEILSNGAIVCKAHKLEVCGACAMDFRPLNKEMGKTVPPPEKPVVSKKETKATTSIGEGQLDPSSLKKWTQDEGKLQQTFVNCFSMQEKLQSYSGGRPGTDVNYDMRESMVVIAKMLDTTACKTVTIQDEAQSNALCLTITDVLEWTNEDGNIVPLLVCRFQANSVAAPDFMVKMEHMAAALKGANGVQNVPTTRAEVEGFTQLLEKNHRALSPAWITAQKSALPPSFKLSFLTTLKAKLPAAGKTCQSCGQPDAKSRCARCGLVNYCSRECQVSDWKRHKAACRPPAQKSELGEAVVVQLGGGLPDGNRFLSTVSLNQPVGQAAQRIQDTSKPVDGVRDGEARIVKVQTPAARGESMLVYDKTKSIQTMIHRGNSSAGGYDRLFDLIESKGQAGGRKGYFNAAVMANGKELHVYAKEMMGLQPW